MALSQGKSIPATLARAVHRARWMMIVERFIAASMPAVSVFILIIATALLGLWQAVPTPWSYGLTFAALAGLVASLWPLRGLVWPSLDEARRRVEERSEFLHRPVATLSDRLSSADESSQALWARHLEKMRASVHSARSGPVDPRLAAHDPFALRVIPILLLFVSVFVAHGEAGDRLASIITSPAEQVQPKIVRIDAWVTPPVYTGEPPIFLTRDAADPAGTSAPITIPQNSTLTVRVLPGDDITLVRESGEVSETVDGDMHGGGVAPEARASFNTKVEDTTRFVLRSGELDLKSWAFNVRFDQPPSIAFAEDPAPALSGALTLTYSLKDDYGVASANAAIEAAPLDGDGAASVASGRPLYEAPEIALTLPQARPRDAQGQTIRDLLAHPWAGTRVSLTLSALDEAGQSGLSEPKLFTLPQRSFSHPMAKAIVEQRRILALDGDAVVNVATAIDALTIGAETFIDNTNHYLMLRSAYWRLQSARDDDMLREGADYLWDIALYIEDGDLSAAERRLRTAQQNLMDALENDASDEDIERLMSELRNAMNEFMREMARNAENMPESAQMPPMDPSQMLSQDDLQQMMDQIENLAKSGAKDQAKQLLSEMQRMMENLRNARRMPQQQGGESEMSEAMRELQEMIQRQRELMDQTFQLDQNQRRGDQQQGQNQPGQQGQPSQQQQLDQLGQGQQSLREALENMMRQLGEMGMGENPALGEAGEAMGRAEGDLRGQEPGRAVGEQGQALENLRQGTQSMMESMLESMAEQGQGGEPQDQRDPLGRPQRTEGPDLGNTVKVPGEIDIQRAREILQELRRRLSDPARPSIERDYLERLITPY